jgi:hypothetical protein
MVAGEGCIYCEHCSQEVRYIEKLNPSIATGAMSLQARVDELTGQSERAWRVIRQIGEHVDRLREGEVSYSIVDRVKEMKESLAEKNSEIYKLQEILIDRDNLITNLRAQVNGERWK